MVQPNLDLIANFKKEEINPLVKVSVHVITYNQEKYIKEAIEGVLKQKVSFNYELIIGDDCSTDDTRKIIQEYYKKHPNIIKLLLHPHNLGPKGLEGKNNFLSVYSACMGEYIALLEGDDYWIDPNKLQKQVNFLEANPEYSICFHRVYYKYDGQETLFLSHLNTSEKEETYSINDLAKENIIHTPSVVYRNGVIELPLLFNEAAAGDYVLHMVHAKKGLIKYFPEPMAVYRVHNNGVWSTKSIGETYPKWLALLDKLMTEDFQEATIKNLLQQKEKRLNEYILWLLGEKQYDKAKQVIHTYYTKDENAGIELLANTFIQHISNLDAGISNIKKSRSYLLANKLSKFKNHRFLKALKRKSNFFN